MSAAASDHPADPVIHLFWHKVRAPLVVFVVVAGALAFTSIDSAIARKLFFDAAAHEWIGRHAWLTNGFIHKGGQWLIRSVVILSFATWALSFRVRRLQPVRRASLYLAVAITLSVGIVGLLKTVTNVDCPRDLQLFGGKYPYVHLFGDRPDALKRAHCFPAAHASAGYALLSLYYLWRERSVRRRRIGLVIGIVTGLIFGISQQTRGAHFVSHDVWSACLVWLVVTGVYCFVFRARLWDGAVADAAMPRSG